MISELDKLRDIFGRFLVVLFWLHVPLLGLVAWLAGRSMIGVALAGTILALAYHLSWWRHGSAPVTRYISAVALMGEPALLVYLLSGNAWQMDMHMYFFATLALTIAWCDRGVILLAAVTVAVHHLVLDYLLPAVVFPDQGDIARVLLHAAIVAFQTAVLVWLSEMLVESFTRIGAMSAEILVKNEALEERTHEAEAANRAKSIFLANMSHEIRTPMNAILGFCHLVLRTEMTPRQRDYITKIDSAGASLLRLLNDILDFSKNEAGKLSLEQRSFNLQDAVDEQMQLAGVGARTKGLTLEAVIEADVPAFVIGDALRFNQVLLNLVSNAVKFTEEGSITVSIRLASPRAETMAIEVSVADTGIGMDEDQLAGLFGSFAQADSSTTRRFGGTGLGLAISKQIVELMGGTIRAESRAGHGSRFIFTVQIGEGGATASLSPSSEALLPPDLLDLRVLIADDNPASREILEGIFSSWSIEAEQVASGAEVLGALEAAEREGRPYDLLMLDWKMPGMDGIATINAMHANARLTQLPAIFLVTAYGLEEFRAEAKDADIASFLVKPVDPQLLRQTIVNLFGPDKAPTEVNEIVPRAIPTVAAHLRGQRVLLAEDNEINREIAIELLTDAGLRVDIAANGRIACDRVMEFGATYAGVLMDVQMPEMDGLEATGRIRESWPADELPIIAMTAHAYETERQRCFAAGMNDHIAKPVDPGTLVETLNRWLKPRIAAAHKAPAKNPAENDVGVPWSIDLPDDLPPFDLRSALERVNGKAPLLRKLILDFGNKYGDVAVILRGQIDRAMFADARALAHTLKGVAGSLGLGDVARVAAAIETALAAANAAGINGHLAELEGLLVDALAAVRSLAPAAPASPSLRPADDITLAASMQALGQSLQRRSLRARADFEAFALASGLSQLAVQTHPIKRAMDRLDYERALLALADEYPMPRERKES